MEQLWEMEVEVPPLDEQETEVVFDSKLGGFTAHKQLIVGGSSIFTSGYIGDQVAERLENLSPGEYEIHIVEV